MVEDTRVLIAPQVAKGKLHTLDFVRVKDSLRSSARKLLTDTESGLPNSLAQQLSTPSMSTATAAAAGAAAAGAGGKKAAAGGPLAAKGGKGRLMTPEEKKRVVEALTRAKTGEEVRKLERMLAEGIIPEGEGDALAASA